MTHKVFVISETSAGFHDKLTDKTLKAFLHHGCDTQLWNMPVNKGTWKLIYQEARAIKATQIHIVRALDPVSLQDAVENCYDTNGNIPISFLLMGLSAELRDDARLLSLIQLSHSPRIRKIVLMSIDPTSCLLKAVDVRVNPDKLAPLHEPPYETMDFYRNVSQEMARMRLGLPLSKKVALYFGTYFFSKGPDLALEAAKNCPGIEFYFVGNLSLGSIEIKPADYQRDNIHFINEYVSEAEARDWFRAADVILLPYRKFYRHDTSGIFNQAMLAQRPVVVPNFPPFSKIIGTRNVAVGAMFDAEDIGSLQRKIEMCVQVDVNSYNRHYDEYLKRQTKWDDIAKEVLWTLPTQTNCGKQ